jgi:predicted aspartyl protease
VRYPLLTSIFAIVLSFCANGLFAATPIPFQFRDGMICLKVTVAGNSEPLNFLLDSGAGASVLDLAVARRLGLKLGESQNVQGVHSRSVAYRVKTFAAHIAGVPVPASVLALDLSGPGHACQKGIDGLLGVDFFRGRIVQIDFVSRTICLLQRTEVDETDCEILALTARNDALCTRVAIDGNAPQWLRLDTGCNTALEWVVTGHKAKKLGATTLGLNSRQVREIHTDVQLGTLHLPAIRTGIHTEQMFAGEAGLIGNGLLSQFRVTVDADKARVLLGRN